MNLKHLGLPDISTETSIHPLHTHLHTFSLSFTVIHIYTLMRVYKRDTGANDKSTQ